ncbi:hypothetical protein [Streptomyces sp. OE57]|uniref:hypothetical protein n=1 Tax=Streptomyces lacaronensis TaxID=3379885 RepID=UPI0039B776E7
MSAHRGTKSTAHPARGRPARLSRELIVSTAPRCDLTTLTMRELATRLGADTLLRGLPARLPVEHPRPDV